MALTKISKLSSLKKSAKGITYVLLWYGSILLGFFSLYCLLLPCLLLHRRWYRRGTECLFVMWESFAVALLEILFSVQFRISGDLIRSSETSIIMSNHRNRLDWNFIWGALAHGSQPPSHRCKIVLKSPIKHMPGLGWIMQMTCFLYLKRCWTDDKNAISKTIDYFKHIKLRYQILLFPEGTNLTEDTKRRSDNYADKHGLPKYNYVLHPRTTGLVFLAREMMEGNQLSAIYDMTVMYPKTLPENEFDLLKGHFPEEVHFLVKRYGVEDLPKTGEELQNWLLNIWAKKEEMLQLAYDKGHFPGTEAASEPVNASYLSVFFWLGLMIGTLYLLWNSIFFQVWCVAHSIFFFLVSALTDGLHDLEMNLYSHFKKKIK